MAEAGKVVSGEKASGQPGSAVDQLWLGVLQQLTGSVAHELRNALNGVAVNLEVVRSRSGRDGVAASALGSFATAASDQLEQVIAMTDALMGLTRAAHGPAVIGRTTDLVAALIRPRLAVTGGSLELAVEGEAPTSVSAEAARLFITAVLLGAVEASRAPGDDTGVVALSCRVRPANGVELRVDGAFVQPLAVAVGIIRLARQHDVGIRPAGSSITMTFPA